MWSNKLTIILQKYKKDSKIRCLHENFLQEIKTKNIFTLKTIMMTFFNV